MSSGNQDHDINSCMEHLMAAREASVRNQLPFLNYLIEMALHEALNMGGALGSGDESAESLARAHEAVM